MLSRHSINKQARICKVLISNSGFGSVPKGFGSRTLVLSIFCRAVFIVTATLFAISSHPRIADSTKVLVQLIQTGKILQEIFRSGDCPEYLSPTGTYLIRTNWYEVQPKANSDKDKQCNQRHRAASAIVVKMFDRYFNVNTVNLQYKYRYRTR